MLKNFDRFNFYLQKNEIKCSQIDNIVGELLLSSRIGNNFYIRDISSLENLRESSILFIDNIIFENKSKNIHIVTNNEKNFDNIKNENIHYVKDIDRAYRLIINQLLKHEDELSFEDNFINEKNSFISKSAKIGDNTKISNNCTIGRGVKLGSNCIIKNNVVIKNAIIGNNVIIGDNSTIGSSGFGFNLKDMGSINLSPQIGIVYIEDNVRIGSSCTIDRGKIDYTFIGKNTMLDNQIHIAHNVKLGENVCIAAQSGISGSTIIGNRVIIGGQAGISGHIKIGNNVVIAAKSGVTKNINDNSIVAGFPAIDIKEWKKNIIKNRSDRYK